MTCVYLYLIISLVRYVCIFILTTGDTSTHKTISFMSIRSSISIQQLKVRISKEEQLKAKEIAKSQGMTFQGWIGSLIKRELAQNEKQSINEYLNSLQERGQDEKFRNQNPR